MTREDRIKLINHMKYNRSVGADYLITDKDADEIIKALEQQNVLFKSGLLKDCEVCRVEQEPMLDKIRAEIADLDDADYDYEGYYKAVTDALKIIDKYKAEMESEE